MRYLQTRPAETTARSLMQRNWIRDALRIVTLGLFFVNRRSLLMRLMRAVLSCLTVALLLVLALTGLIVWWAVGLF